MVAGLATIIASFEKAISWWADELGTNETDSSRAVGKSEPILPGDDEISGRARAYKQVAFQHQAKSSPTKTGAGLWMKTPCIRGWTCSIPRWRPASASWRVIVRNDRQVARIDRLLTPEKYWIVAVCCSRAILLNISVWLTLSLNVLLYREKQHENEYFLYPLRK